MLKTEGNYNNHIGLPLTLLQLEEDTEMAVVEMGMSARGEIALLSELARPEAAVITNIGESHLMQLGSRKEIARAKLEILKGLQPGGFFVYPGDEPLLRELMDDRVFREQMGFSKPAGMKLFRFGETDDNEMYPVSIMLDGFQTHFHLNRPEDTTFTVPLPGRHNVLNAAAAIAVCKYMGVAEKDIVRGLEQARIARMRFEWLRGLNGATIINDAYNASPSSVRAALDLIEDLKGYGRKIVILGDILELGEEEVKFHREIGRYLDPDTIDYVLTFGLLAENIAEEAKKRFPEGRVHPFSDKMQLARWAAGMMQANDLLLVKGSRGMKLEEVVEQLKEPD